MNFDNKALRDLARGAPCTFGFPCCDGGGETSVWVHSDFARHGKGKGLKAHDCFGAIGCGPCHATLPNITMMSRLEVMHDAMEATLLYLWENRLIQVAGHTQREPAPKKLAKILPRNWPPRAA